MARIVRCELSRECDFDAVKVSTISETFWKDRLGRRISWEAFDLAAGSLPADRIPARSMKVSAMVRRHRPMVPK